MRIVCRVPRKRIAIPLKDERTFDRQIQVQIRENNVALAVPTETKIKRHDDYQNTLLYLHRISGYVYLIQRSDLYGKALAELVSPETERLARKIESAAKCMRPIKRTLRAEICKKLKISEVNNLGKSKYDRQKERERLRTATYINSEINRMFREEKPRKLLSQNLSQEIRRHITPKQ